MKAKILIIILLLIFIMTGIVHERIVVSRDKGMAEDWNANHQITGDVDMGQYSWLNQVIENRVDFPAGPVEGQVIYRSDLNQFYVYNGATWDYLVYTDADARGAINNIFGADGHADANIDMDSHHFTDMADGSADSDSATYGQIAIPTGLNVWSCPGTNFKGWRQGDQVSEDYHYTDNTVEADEDGVTLFAPVFLPYGAVVTVAQVFGAAPGESWVMIRQALGSTAASTMASAGVGEADVSIDNATINNDSFSYGIYTTSLDDGERIYGAKITYTL